MTYQDKWALITGASAGIGAVFAKELANRGSNVVLSARRVEKLKTIAAEIEQTFGVKTKVIAADFAKPDAPQHVVDALTQEGIQIDILINNAGFGMPGYFTQNEWAEHDAFIELMITSYAHLTRLLLPGMAERDYGRIIQVASVAGLVPGSAGHTLYGPTKAFLVSFAQSLAAEYEDTGINASALCPGFTYSEFHDVNETRSLVSQLPGYMFMPPEPVVEGALDAVERGHVIYVPGLWNKFVVWLMKALPRPWAAQMVKRQSAKFRRKNA